MNDETSIALLKNDLEWLKNQRHSDKAARDNVPLLIRERIDEAMQKQTLVMDNRLAEIKEIQLEMKVELLAAIRDTVANASNRLEKNIDEKYEEKVEKSYKVANFLTSAWVGITGIPVIGGAILGIVNIFK